LHVYQEQIEKIPLMGVEVIPVDSTILLRSSEIRTRYGFLINDSLVVASALKERVTGIASADKDFDRLRELKVFRPADLAL
jgi:predicted nucleic acid-binding protein